MKVQNNAIQAYARSAINPTTPIQPLPQEPAAQPASDEAAHVTLSAQARELALKQDGADRHKVDALREKLNSGELKVNSQVLATLILDAFA
jgi:flagellar biosynthesis anti-sigma factor FlgM